LAGLINKKLEHFRGRAAIARQGIALVVIPDEDAQQAHEFFFGLG
jgi:hypothetical protein